MRKRILLLKYHKVQQFNSEIVIRKLKLKKKTLIPQKIQGKIFVSLASITKNLNKVFKEEVACRCSNSFKNL